MQDPDLAPARTPREVELGRLWREMKDHPEPAPLTIVPDDPIIAAREYEDDERADHDEVEAAEEEYARQLREDW